MNGGNGSATSAGGKWNSATITDGRDRAGARAMFKAIGFTDADLAKPLVGIAHTWIETMPCGYNLRDLVEHVKRGVREGGGTPMEFNTIAISDGITMGTEGMKASLVSREVIADSIELVGRGYMFDAIVGFVRLRQDRAGNSDGAHAAQRPSCHALRRHHPAWPLRWRRSHRRRRLRSHRRALGWQDQRRAAAGHGRSCLSRGRRVRRPVHGQHDGDRVRVSRVVAGRQRQPAGPRRAQRPGGLSRRQDRDGLAAAQRSAARPRDARSVRERHRGGCWNRRFDERGAALAGDRARSGRPAHDR